MKRRLNLLCTVLLIAFGAHFLMQTYYLLPEMMQAFKEGYEAGIHMGEKAVEENDKSHLLKGEEFMPVPLALTPHSYTNPMPDSLYNAKTGKWMPAQIENITVEYKKEIDLVQHLLLLPVSLLSAAGLLLALISFIRLLLAINKSVIFEWKNVKRLRLIGVGFIVTFICHFIIGYVNYHFAWNHIMLADYKISSTILWDNVNLILGFISLLLAEVFAIGLSLKEKQELTI
ncbi:MAG: DUF2975 domain-containing protein [Tannerellaceae bacterium]|nr:DUF2975 domain-containing protein [Tannerellaceae bacterium]